MAEWRANSWLIEQNRCWRELAGATVTRWVGLDSNTGTDEELIFLEPDAPFQQLGALRIERGAAVPLDFGIYQGLEAFGLSMNVSDGAPQYKPDWYRESDLSRLPIGKVERVEVRLDDRGEERDVMEALLVVAGEPVLIAAAEAYPRWGPPQYAWGDESFFVFSDPSAADSVEWSNGRQFTTRAITVDSGDVFTYSG